jgi:mannose-6-phosphate isomerase-like protein (cupin superfamily)
LIIFGETLSRRRRIAMPVIRAAAAPTFNLHGISVTGLAAPSRGSQESSVWRVRLPPGAPPVEHTVDREEIFVALSGHAVVTLDGQSFELGVGDTLVVPANHPFSLGTRAGELFEALAVAPAGVRATIPPGPPFAPPWTE